MSIPTNGSVVNVSPQALRLHRLICKLAARRDGYASVRTEKLGIMLGQDAKRPLPYSVRMVRYLLAELRRAGYIETQTDYRMLYVAPLLPPPPLQERKRTPAPPKPFSCPLIAQPIAEEAAPPPPQTCTPSRARTYSVSDSETRLTRRTTTRKAEPAPEPEPAAAALLKENGVDPIVADRLGPNYTQEYVRQKIELPGFKAAQKPAAWLVSAVVRNFLPPVPPHPSEARTMARTAYSAPDPIREENLRRMREHEEALKAAAGLSAQEAAMAAMRERTRFGGRT